MTINDTSRIPPAIRDYYDRLIMFSLYPNLIHTKFAQKRILPTKNGDTVIFRRWSKMETVPIPLVEGITPPGAALSLTDIKVRVQQYGNFFTYTDKVELTVENSTLNDGTKLLAQNLGQTLDEVTRDVLASTSSVMQCAKGINGRTPTELSDADISAATMTLVRNNAKMITKVIPGTNAFATAPVPAGYWGYIHADLLDDLKAVSSFERTASYASQGTVLPEEWGATDRVRWLQTSAGSVSSANPAVYNCFILGEEAYAVVHLGSETGDFYVEGLGSSGTADPLHQRGTCGWTHPFAARIINDCSMINLMATHS